MQAIEYTLKYDQKTNSLTIGGPRYLRIETRNHAYGMIINGNWMPTVLTRQRQMYSNSYMGVDFRVDTLLNTTLTEALKSELQKRYLTADDVQIHYTQIKNLDAVEVLYKSSDSVGKIVMIKDDSDYVTMDFFVDKTKYQESDRINIDKMAKTFMIYSLSQ